MFEKTDRFGEQLNYNEGGSSVSLLWSYVNDRYNYHIKILIHEKTVWFDFIGVFCRVSLQIYIDINYC